MIVAEHIDLDGIVPLDERDEVDLWVLADLAQDLAEDRVCGLKAEQRRTLDQIAATAKRLERNFAEFRSQIDLGVASPDLPEPVVQTAETAAGDVVTLDMWSFYDPFNTVLNPVVQIPQAGEITFAELVRQVSLIAETLAVLPEEDPRLRFSRDGKQSAFGSKWALKVADRFARFRWDLDWVSRVALATRLATLAGYPERDRRTTERWLEDPLGPVDDDGRGFERRGQAYRQRVLKKSAGCR